MPRPVAIEARHHLAQRLLVEDQQAAPPTGQVVEATAQRRLDAALRAVAQALALAQLAASDGPRARMRQGHRDAVFEHPDLDAAVVVAADQEPSAQRASAAAGAFHHEGPGLPARAWGGAEDRAAFEQAHPSLAAVVGDIDGALCVQFDLAAIHQPQDAHLALAGGVVGQPAHAGVAFVPGAAQGQQHRRRRGPAAPALAPPPGAARRAGDRRLNHRPRFGQRSQLFPGPLRQRQRGRVPGVSRQPAVQRFAPGPVEVAAVQADRPFGGLLADLLLFLGAVHVRLSLVVIEVQTREPARLGNPFSGNPRVPASHGPGRGPGASAPSYRRFPGVSPPRHGSAPPDG